MQLRKTTVPTLFYVTFFALCVIGLILGSIFDLNISKAIASPNGDNPFGAFMETFGLAPAYMIIGVGGTLFGLGCFALGKKLKSEGRKGLGIFLVVLAIVVAVGSFAAGTIFIGDQIDGTHPAYDNYGIRISNFYLAYVVGAILQLAPMAIVFFVARHDDYASLIKVGFIIAFAVLFRMLVVTLLKDIALRPRFRFLFGDDYHGVWEGKQYVYAAWYEFHPSNPGVDLFKSWPSGHSAGAVVFLCLAYFPLVLKKRFKHDVLVFFLIGVAYTLLMMLARIMAGAHYLSDVSTGALIGAFGLFIAAFVFEKCITKYPKSLNETESPIEAK